MQNKINLTPRNALLFDELKKVTFYFIQEVSVHALNIKKEIKQNLSDNLK